MEIKDIVLTLIGFAAGYLFKGSERAQRWMKIRLGMIKEKAKA